MNSPIKELQQKISHHARRGYTPIDHVGSFPPNFGSEIPVVWAEYRLLLNPEDKNIYHKNVVSGEDAVEMCRELVELVEMWEDDEIDYTTVNSEQQRIMHKYCGDITPTVFECAIDDSTHNHLHLAKMHARVKHDAETDEEIDAIINPVEGETIDTSPREKGARHAEV